MVQIKCVRMENGDYGFAECNNRRCDMFNRRPWLSDTIFKNAAAATRSPIFC